MMMGVWRSSPSPLMGRCGISGKPRLGESGAPGLLWVHHQAQLTLLVILSWPRMTMGAWRLSQLAPTGPSGTPGRYQRGAIGAVELSIHKIVHRGMIGKDLLKRRNNLCPPNELTSIETDAFVVPFAEDGESIRTTIVPTIQHLSIELANLALIGRCRVLRLECV